MPEVKTTRTIRSFVQRAGRLTKAQENALHTLFPVFGLQYSEEKINIEKTFHRSAETILEIGFGMGTSLLEQAKNYPEKNFIGIEVHQPGIGSLLNAIEKDKLTNIRIYSHDAVDILMHCIPDASLDKIQIFFPDPWPKKKHHKRRLIQSEFVDMMYRKLKISGILHCATDWENYAEWMMDVLSSHPGFENIAGKGKFAARPEDRPLTKFENRGNRLGHSVWDLLFKKGTHHGAQSNSD